ncbi:hypothetical protein K3495_g1309 [Podosphaera aphanis]|nr:hypothetical protein K3495_g1309 [Podosphaera aphanis]
MDVFYAYTYGSSLWLAIQCLPLIISPTIMITLLSPDFREPSVLEEYFSRSLGMALLTISAQTILLSGSVPLTSSVSDTLSTATSESKAPYALPSLTITMVYHSAISIFCYARYNTSDKSAFVLGSIGSGILACIGLWCILFATDNGRISRKTGADKRTSGFPFGNRNAASTQKKQMAKAAS